MIGTKAKLRHYRVDPDGRRSLIWAQDGETGYEEFALGDVIQGSADDLEVVQSQLWTPNTLVNEGENDILDTYFNDQAVRASLYFRLYADGAIAETDTLTTLTSEVTGTSYDGVVVTRGTHWSEPAVDAGDGETTSTTRTFTAGGTWTNADELVLATVQNGTAGLFLAWVALSTTRQLEDTDTLDVTLAVKLA